jgi:hypothetical protein
MDIVTVSTCVPPRPPEAASEPSSTLPMIRVSIPQGPGMAYDTVALLTPQQAKGLVGMLDAAITVCAP